MVIHVGRIPAADSGIISMCIAINGHMARSLAPFEASLLPLRALVDSLVPNALACSPFL